MSHHDKDEEARARLHELKVDEVSIVDRAANKRRFLLVKRDGGNMSGEVISMAERGLSSLARLALDVQMEQEGSIEKFVELLRSTADDVAKVAGLSMASDDADDKADAEGTDEDTSADKEPAAEEQQAEQTKEEPVEDDTAAVAQEESKEETKEPEKDPESSPEITKELVASMVNEAVAKAQEPLNERFDSIAKSLEALSAQNVQFSQTIAAWSEKVDGLEKMEKSFDPPNSQSVDPAGDVQGKVVSWPLDMNSNN